MGLVYNRVMVNVGRFLQKIKGIYWYITVWFFINLLFLTKFPFMHSDESWLSGLTRSMMEGGLNSTETFFDLMPRYPHAIKTIFHIIQMGFSKLFGYGLFSFRLISLISGIAVLVLFYKIAVLILTREKTAQWAAVALSVCIQFIYASHFARQEIIILAGMLGIIYYILKNNKNWNWKKDIAAAVMTGLFAGIHPNSFLIAAAAGSLYLYFILNRENLKLTNLLTYICATGLIAGLFVGLSYVFDGNFITHYLEYGDGLGVQSALAAKYDGILYYYKKLFDMTGVTYYTPFIKGELILFATAAATALLASFWDKKLLKALLPLIAVNIGIIIIGRFSQPGIIFIFPFGFLLVFMILEKIAKGRTWMMALAICLALAVNSIIGIIPYLNNDYDGYIAQINANVPVDASVLANLNSEYAYGSGMAYDYRNLAYLPDHGMSFADYIESRGIEYIIYPEEMDFIYERRPVWNVVYGNLFHYYEDMNEFLDGECEMLYEFASAYAMRIHKFANDREWAVRIYKVNNYE